MRALDRNLHTVRAFSARSWRQTSIGGSFNSRWLRAPATKSTKSPPPQGARAFCCSSYDNAFAETSNDLYKTGVIRRRGPWWNLRFKAGRSGAFGGLTGLHP
ncbi:hypothetical protein E6C67_17555 [Azospirillum sp. TSA2s]|nr:hypothetical protein E6C67_17555 [Azospirillum sp. TSA2s]